VLLGGMNDAILDSSDKWLVARAPVWLLDARVHLTTGI
jgi:hypothetical protein